MSPQVTILSKENLIADFLKKTFSEKGCGVLVSSSARDILEPSSYLVIVNIGNAYAKDKILHKKLVDHKPKVIVINDVWSDGFDVESIPLKHLFVDQLLPGMTSVLAQIYAEAQKSHVFVPKEAWLSVATLADLGEKVISELFSFPENKKILFGKLVSFRELVLLLNSSASVSVNVNSPSRLPRRDLEIFESAIDLKTIPWQTFATEKPQVKKKKINIPTPRIKARLPKVGKRHLVAGLAAIASVLVAPYLMLLSATAMSFISYKTLKSGNISAAKNMVALSRVLSDSSVRMLSVFPMPLRKHAALLTQATTAAGRVLAVSDFSKEVSEEAIANIHLELTALYRELSFIDGELRKDEVPLANFFPEVKKLSEYREYVLAASRITENLPAILGFDKPKTYMVLFQNNMELRPTGGFIGSFALVTVSKGEIIDDTVYDVYSADGQLKGYIEPPSPIVEHLGEASWTLRDSNWDPDFTTSAARAEWFLDKSLDRKVDGVIGINLETAQEYLRVVEPLHLPNFNDSLDSKNMYEKVQHEVEDSFFPGSRKKAQYLSALSEALLSRIEEASTEEYVRLLAATVKKLNSRDIQVYLHDETTQRAFAEQNWDGQTPSGIFSGIVEANLGVNKANYFVDREVNVALSLTPDHLEQEVSLKLKNNATSRDRVPEERYKAYVRAFAPAGATFAGAQLTSADEASDIDVDIEKVGNRVEYGALVEVLPGEEKILTFKMRTKADFDFENPNSFSYKWWKQSGTGEYPFSIQVKTPPLSETKWTPPFRLTEEGVFSYNTNLAEDIEVSLDWNKK